MRPSRTNGLMLAIVAAGILSAAYVASVTGGDLNPTAPPAATMRSLNDIYQSVSGQPSNWAPMPSIAQVTGAGAIHMQVTGQVQGAIRGSCTVKERLNTSVVVGVFHEVISPRDAASGLPTGRRQHKPIVVTKYIDKATPLLYAALVNNENLPHVFLNYYRPDRDGVPQIYYIVELRNANIAGIQEGFPNTENISFTYSKIIWTWTDGGITAEDDWETPIG
jgi:type VI secretion system secreted protein Hcp